MFISDSRHLSVSITAASLIWLLTSCSPVPTMTPLEPSPTWPAGCELVEDKHALPEASKTVYAALQAAGLPVTAVDATATGQACILPGWSDSPPFFTRALDLNIHIPIGAPPYTDSQWGVASDVLDVLLSLSSEEVPNWKQGILTFTFERAPSGYTAVSFPPETLNRIIEQQAQGVRGEPLWAPTEEPCNFNWARHPLPDVTAQVQTKVNEAGLKNIMITAEAFGEDCIKQDGSVSGFAVMQTNYTIEIQLSDLGDRDAYGDAAAAALALLMEFQSGSMLNPPPGRIQMIVPSAPELYALFDYEVARQAIAKKLTGADLIDFLKKPR